jgi:hypothetical protein
MMQSQMMLLMLLMMALFSVLLRPRVPGADGAVTGCHAGGGHRCCAVRSLREAALEAGPGGAGRRGEQTAEPPRPASD